MITKAIHDAPDHWDTHLNGVCFAYRASVHATTKCTPNLLMLNREIDLPIDLLMPPDPNFEEPKCPVKYVEWVRQALRYAGENARQHTRMNMPRQKRNYDISAGCPEFRVGDSVRWFYPPEAMKKHGRKWHGPYLVTEKINDVLYKVQRHPTGSERVIHVDNLKIFEGIPLENWITEEEEEINTKKKRKKKRRRASAPKTILQKPPQKDHLDDILDAREVRLEGVVDAEIQVKGVRPRVSDPESVLGYEAPTRPSDLDETVGYEQLN